MAASIDRTFLKYLAQGPQPLQPEGFRRQRKADAAGEALIKQGSRLRLDSCPHFEKGLRRDRLTAGIPGQRDLSAAFWARAAEGRRLCSA